MTQAKSKRPRAPKAKTPAKPSSVAAAFEHMRLLVTVDDGTEHEVTVKVGDLVAFERMYGISFGEVDTDNPRIEYVLFLGWKACKRLGLTELEFDEWLDRVDGVEEAPGNPLDASSTTSSS